MKKTHVYVVQYDNFWRLTWAEWLAICEDSQREDWEGYLLPDNRHLKRRPRTISVAMDADEHRSYTAWPHILVQPLDWEAEDFKDWMQEHATKSED
jgi:hypothetical protein